MTALLGDVCTFTNGGTPSRHESRYFTGNIPWITGADIVGPTVGSGRLFITEEAIRESATNRVPAGTLLLVTRTSVGKVAIAEQDLCFSQDITALKPKPDRLDVGYLAHFLRTKESHFARLARGATIRGIPRSVLADLRIPLPPPTEQRRIADILDRAEALRAKRRAALAHLDALSQSIFLDMFGDLEAKQWPMVTANELALPVKGSIRTGPFGSQLLHSEFVDKGVAVLGIDNVVDNDFKWAKRRYISEAKYHSLRRYTVAPGDVLITIMGTCGRCAVVPDDVPVAINTKHLCCISLDRNRCLPTYLHAYFLRHPVARRYLEQKAKGAIMAGLNMEIIKAMPVPVPPIDLQHKFSDRLAEVSNLKVTQNASLMALHGLFSSLQHRAFRGEL